MALLPRIAKRLVIGRPVRSDTVGHTLLPKRLALPIFASDALSSVAYATQEILLVLTLAGSAYLFLAPWLAAVVVILLLTVAASYRQVVEAYPTGGGDYEVATKNIGRPAGVIVASALMVDYVMTVAVSVSSGVDNIISAAPALNPHRVEMALVFITILTAVNLRGVKEAGTAFALPTYAFAVGVGVMIVTGVVKAVVGHPPVAESAKYTLHAQQGYHQLTVFALIFFALRAFSSGCTALTGVEAIANGVPAFQKPKAKNAQKTLLMMAGLACSMFIGITVLALVAKVHIVEPGNVCDLGGYAGCQSGGHPAPQRTVIAQLASAIFGGEHSVGLLLHPGRDRAHPDPGREHRVQRFPAARLDPGPGPQPAPPAAHPRRPAGVQQRRHRPGRGRRVPDLRLPRQHQRPDPALHRRGVHVVHARPDRHGPALEPAAAHRTRPERAAPDVPLPGHQRLRRQPDRGRAGHRHHRQVHRRGLPGADRDADPLRHDARHLQALPPRRRGAGRRTRTRSG